MRPLGTPPFGRKPQAPGAKDPARTRLQAEDAAGRLPPLLVAAERVAASVAQGVHGRRRVGQGETFWQFRRYQPGDQPSMVDWRQSAKTDPLFVRENEWEAAQSVWLWRDRSGSMDYRSDAGLPSKRDRAEVLTLALAILLNRAGERVAGLNGEGRPMSGPRAVSELALSLVGDGAGTGLPPARPLPRFARVVLIGDLLGPPERLATLVRQLANRGVSGHLLQVLDPAEESLPFEGRVLMTGLEGEEELLVPRVEPLRDAYIARLRRHRAELLDIARSSGWSFAVHHTDKSPQSALLGLWGAMAGQPVATPPVASPSSPGADR